MKLVMCSILDLKAVTYTQPTCFHNLDVAKRAATILKGDSGQQYGMHPEDYVLYHVGYFDSETGRTESLKDNKIICTFDDLVVPENIYNQLNNKDEEAA